MNSFFNRSGKLPMIVLIIVAVVVLGGVGGFVVMKMHKGKGHAKKHVEYVEWKFNDMLMTLADTQELHYLKMNMSMEMEYAEKSKIPPEGEDDKEKSKALDVINSVCSGKTLAQLIPEKGKDALKEEITKKLNDKLENSKVHDVYLTYFALQ